MKGLPEGVEIVPMRRRGGTGISNVRFQFLAIDEGEERRRKRQVKITFNGKTFR